MSWKDIVWEVLITDLVFSDPSQILSALPFMVFRDASGSIKMVQQTSNYV